MQCHLCHPELGARAYGTSVAFLLGGVLWEAHSNFGWLDPLLLPRSAPDAPVAKRFFGPEGVGELDESEF